MGRDPVSDADPISAARHGDTIREAVEAHDKSAWCYYVPFLCCYHLPPGREVRVVVRDDSLCLLVVKKGDRGAGVDLMVPPLPLDVGTLQNLSADLRPQNEGRDPRILWADAADAAEARAYTRAERPVDLDRWIGHAGAAAPALAEAAAWGLGGRP